MNLIHCPDCDKKISPRANFCPHCGCPSQYFGSVSTPTFVPAQRLPVSTVRQDITEVANYLLAFDRDYSSLFQPSQYITQRELQNLHEAYDHIADMLNKPGVILKNTDLAAVNSFLKKHESLDDDALAHNNDFVTGKVDEYKEYFDNILLKIDRNIVLDNEQRCAVVTEDDYVLLIAGAGAGKTTTMAAKVKYLVDKCGVAPEDIIVISYTNKAIGELRDKINKSLGIPAKISTFHAFAFEIVRRYSDTPPEVSFKSYVYIYEMLEKAVFDNNYFVEFA